MKQALVITSIAAPNNALKQFAKACQQHDILFYVIGDKKSPAEFNLPGCEFWSISQQDKLPFQLSKTLPQNSYARKNLGYLLAIQAGTKVIFESDDDNFPKENFFTKKELLQHAHVIKDHGWINIYNYFTKENIWPRGFPLNHIKKATPALNEFAKAKTLCPIQQGLADENPDVDAIYRLTQPLPISFTGQDSIALGNNAWCPFNTQSTIFFEVAFPLLYLPSTCNMRVTDIWKSFVAQRIAWTNNWNILFTPSTVYQERNEHDLMKDFTMEIDGYLQNEALCQALMNLDLKSGEQHIQHNMLVCYEKMLELKLVQKEEMTLLNNWFEDIVQASKAQHPVELDAQTT
jgi:hypothetical protein